MDLRAVDGHGTLAALVERGRVARACSASCYASFAGLDDDAARRVPLAAAKRAVERRLSGLADARR